MTPAADGGNIRDHIFSLQFDAVTAVGLAIRADAEAPTKHALIEPIESMALDEYRAAVARTRGSWTRVWP